MKNQNLGYYSDQVALNSNLLFAWSFSGEEVYKDRLTVSFYCMREIVSIAVVKVQEYIRSIFLINN